MKLCCIDRAVKGFTDAKLSWYEDKEFLVILQLWFDIVEEDVSVSTDVDAEVL